MTRAFDLRTDLSATELRVVDPRAPQPIAVRRPRDLRAPARGLPAVDPRAVVPLPAPPARLLAAFSP